MKNAAVYIILMLLVALLFLVGGFLLGWNAYRVIGAAGTVIGAGLLGLGGRVNPGTGVDSKRSDRSEALDKRAADFQERSDGTIDRAREAIERAKKSRADNGNDGGI